MNNKRTSGGVAALALGSMLLAPISTSAQLNQSVKEQPKPWVKTESKSMPEPIACNPFGLSEQQRKRQRELRTLLFEAGQEVRELPDGYAIGLPATAANILAAAEFVTLERLCCPFFRFELAVGGTAEPVWLRLTGGKDVKAFLESELMRK